MYVMKTIIAVGFTSLISCHAFAELNPQTVQHWKNTGNPNTPYEASEFGTPDRVVAENARYAVISQDAGTSCPAGNQILIDKQQKSYADIDAKTCDDRQFKVEIKNDVLYFKSKGKVTSKYPLPK